jgi:hypothetical protein
VTWLGDIRRDRLVERRRLALDFIEKLFGIAPDGGDGSLEALVLSAIVVVAVAFASRRLIRARLLSRTTNPR